MERAIVRHWSEDNGERAARGASDIFERGGKKKAEVDEETVRSLHAKIVG